VPGDGVIRLNFFQKLAGIVLTKHGEANLGCQIND